MPLKQTQILVRCAPAGHTKIKPSLPCGSSLLKFKFGSYFSVRFFFFWFGFLFWDENKKNSGSRANTGFWEVSADVMLPTNAAGSSLILV